MAVGRGVGNVVVVGPPPETWWPLGKGLGKAVAKQPGAEKQWDFRLGIAHLSC